MYVCIYIYIYIYNYYGIMHIIIIIAIYVIIIIGSAWGDAYWRTLGRRRSVHLGGGGEAVIRAVGNGQS